MLCRHCQSPRIRNLNRTTDLGYAVFRCGDCRRKSNERTGTPFNYLEFPTDIVFEIVLCRLRYKLSLRDLAEMFLLRGFEFTHEAVREWEERFAPLLAGHIRRKRKGKPGRRWYVDENLRQDQRKMGLSVPRHGSPRQPGGFDAQRHAGHDRCP